MTCEIVTLLGELVHYSIGGCGCLCFKILNYTDIPEMLSWNPQTQVKCRTALHGEVSQLLRKWRFLLLYSLCIVQFFKSTDSERFAQSTTSRRSSMSMIDCS